MNKVKLVALMGLFSALSSQISIYALSLTELGSFPGTSSFSQNQDGGPNGTGSAVTPNGETNSTHADPFTGQSFILTNLNIPVGDQPYDDALELTNIGVEVRSGSAATGTTFTLTIADISGTPVNGSATTGEITTVLDTESLVTTSALNTSGQILDFKLSDFVTLTANTQYAFFLSASAGNLVIAGVGNGTTPTFSSGLSSSSVAADTNGSTVGSTVGLASLGLDRTFFLDTVPVPEPADWALVPVIGTIAFFGLRRLRFAPVA